MERRGFIARAATGWVAFFVAACERIGEPLMPKAAKVGSVIDLPVGPFKGVFEADPGAARRDKASEAVNVIFVDISKNAPVLQRPAFVGLTGRIGPTGISEGNGAFQHRRLDGTIDRLLFSEGKMYRWAGDDTTPADVTPGGITINGSGRVYCESYNGKVIVNDETNRPWVFDPAGGTGTYIDLDGIGTAWIAKGAPAIFGGKVFFIVKSKGAVATQNSITWCEELQPLVGYAQPGFDNYWTLAQTSSDVIGSLAAEEAGLAYLRNHGIGVITGTVNSTFKASATRDTVSTTVGTDSPAKVQVGRVTYFVDLDGRMHRMTVGGGEPQALWTQMQGTVETQMANANCRQNVVLNATGAYHEQLDLVLFTIWDRHTIYAFDASTGTYCGTWLVGNIVGVLVGAMCPMTDSAGRSTFVILGTRDNYNGAGQGTVVWRQKRPDEWSPWADQPDVANQVAAPQIDVALGLPWVTGGPGSLARFLEISALVRGDSTQRTVYLEYQYPFSSGVLFAPATLPAVSAFTPDPTMTARFILDRSAQGAAFKARLAATLAFVGGTEAPQVGYRWGVHTAVVRAQITRAAIYQHV